MSDAGTIQIEKGYTGIDKQRYLRVVFVPNNNEYLFVDSLTLNDVTVPVGWSSSPTSTALSGYVMLESFDTTEAGFPVLIDHPVYGALKDESTFDVIIYMEEGESLVFEGVEL